MLHACAHNPTGVDPTVSIQTYVTNISDWNMFLSGQTPGKEALAYHWILGGFLKPCG